MRKKKRARHVSTAGKLLCLFVAGACVWKLTGALQATIANREAAKNTAEISAASTALAAEISYSTGGVLLDVPYLNQRALYPTGCESVSAVMVLQYYGIGIDVDTFIDSHLSCGTAPSYAEDGLLYGCDPWEAFPGDPRTNTGWGCFAPVIVSAMSECLPPQYQANAVYDMSLDAICATYLDQGIPAVFWGTISMAEPYDGLSWTVPDTGETINWMRPMHCLVLVGYDDVFYYFNDPLESKAIAYDKAAVAQAYLGMGAQIVVVTPVQK